jgi:hypothetical protein
MAIIGFLILAAAAVFGIEIVAMNDLSIDVSAFNQVYETSVALLFVAGVVTGLAGALGVMVIRDGMVRRHRLRLEAREADQLRERHIAELEEEHAAMLDRTRAERDDSVDLREHELDREHVTTF